MKDDWFMTAAARIGDLGSPFYGEERQRDVWNEASAVGFQLFLVSSLLAATGMLWLGGPPAVPYALTVLAVTGVASIVTLTYAQRLGVDPGQSSRTARARMIPFLALVVLLLIGLFRATAGEIGFTSGLAWGVVAGTAVALVTIGVTRRRARAQRR